ncbi:TBC1 domain family member 31-like [Physella acuta]|uniref:TBC1 domain family member 31-like n=1 Tax=Physella acuta TaxID=109671 RepID=UPI0027DC48BC|nr:TBC1 domain family member 31-like [Physella acuta]
METEICDKDFGKIWHRKPNPTKDDGLIVKVKHSTAGAFSGPSRNIPFLKASFDTANERFIAGDSQGNIYLFDLTKNRFTLVQKTGQPCTALAFGLHRKSEFLVALGDYSLRCFDADKKELVALMKGHESAIHSISVHMSGHHALTTSSETTLLWDLDTFQRKRKLNIKEDVGLLQAFFLPNSNTIMTCFHDDTIFAWDLDTMAFKYQLPIPIGDSPHYRGFTASRDARYLIAGGKSRFLHLWSLDSHRLIRVIEMPSKVISIKLMEFLQDNYQNGVNQILGVLSQDGIMRFINTDSCKLLFDIGSSDCRIRFATAGPGGRHIVAVTEDGNLNLYNTSTLATDLNKPPPALMKVVTDCNKLSDTMSTESSMRRSKPHLETSKTKLRMNGVRGESDANNNKDTSSDLGGLNKQKLLTILKGYGEYPAKYRMFIWRKILELPENFSAYAALIDKGAHPSYSRLHELYPIKSRKLLRILQRILSAMAHWSPIFGETQFLPTFAFPFVKMFQNNHLICFEMVATILVNWGQHWFEYFPNPPINILGMIENILAHHDTHLLQHFVKTGITSQIYAWPLLESVFSEVLTQDEWLMLWDNILSNHPSFLLMTVVAYTICARGPLMKCTEMDDFKFFYHHRNAMSIKQIIKEAYRLMESTPDDVHPQNILEDYVPLTKGNYPVFNKYPTFIVDYQVQERERIRQEELEFMRQKFLTLDVEKETVQKQQEEQQWYRQQQLLLEAEEKRRRMIQEEEAKLAEQRKRLLALNREVKLKELALLEAGRRKFLQFQKEQREVELRRLDDELQRKALQRDQETDAAIQEAEVKQMELQLQKKLFEQELYREFAIQSQALRNDQDLHRKQTELEDRLRAKVEDTERSRALEARKKMEQKLAVTEQQNIDMWARKELDHKHRMADMDKESDLDKLTSLTAKNRELENEVYELMNNLHRQKKVETALGYDEIAQNRVLGVRNKDRRMKSTEEELLKGRHHTLDLMEKAEDDSDEPVSDVLSRADTFPDDSSGDISRVSFERNRRAFDNQEIALLNEVRLMRQRLATESRTKRPPPPVELG